MSGPLKYTEDGISFEVLFTDIPEVERAYPAGGTGRDKFKAADLVTDDATRLYSLVCHLIEEFAREQTGRLAIHQHLHATGLKEISEQVSAYAVNLDWIAGPLAEISPEATSIVRVAAGDDFFLLDPDKLAQVAAVATQVALVGKLLTAFAKSHSREAKRPRRRSLSDEALTPIASELRALIEPARGRALTKAKVARGLEAVMAAIELSGEIRFSVRASKGIRRTAAWPSAFQVTADDKRVLAKAAAEAMLVPAGGKVT